MTAPQVPDEKEENLDSILSCIRIPSNGRPRCGGLTYFEVEVEAEVGGGLNFWELGFWVVGFWRGRLLGSLTVCKNFNRKLKESNS